MLRDHNHHQNNTRRQLTLHRSLCVYEVSKGRSLESWMKVQNLRLRSRSRDFLSCLRSGLLSCDSLLSIDLSLDSRSRDFSRSFCSFLLSLYFLIPMAAAPAPSTPAAASRRRLLLLFCFTSVTSVTVVTEGDRRRWRRCRSRLASSRSRAVGGRGVAPYSTRPNSGLAPSRVLKLRALDLLRLRLRETLYRRLPSE